MEAELKAMLINFADESDEILTDIEGTIEAIENGESGPEAFADFAQKVDRIMGCASSLNLLNIPEVAVALESIGHISMGCKTLGYRATQIKQPEIVIIAAGFLAEAVEVLHEAINDLRKGYISLDADRTARMGQRLGWLCEKLRLSPDEEKALRKSFGL